MVEQLFEIAKKGIVNGEESFEDCVCHEMVCGFMKQHVLFK